MKALMQVEFAQCSGTAVASCTQKYKYVCMYMQAKAKKSLDLAIVWGRQCMFWTHRSYPGQAGGLGEESDKATGRYLP